VGVTITPSVQDYIASLCNRSYQATFAFWGGLAVIAIGVIVSICALILGWRAFGKKEAYKDFKKDMIKTAIILLIGMLTFSTGLVWATYSTWASQVNQINNYIEISKKPIIRTVKLPGICRLEPQCCPGFCLDLGIPEKDGTCNLTLKPINNDNSEKFHLKQIETEPGGYWIFSQAENKLDKTMDFAGGNCEIENPNDPNNIVTFKPVTLGYDSQQWEISPTEEDGQIVWIGPYPNSYVGRSKCKDFRLNAFTFYNECSKTRIVLDYRNDSPNQKWKIITWEVQTH
jgi:hypothetical protein